IVYLLLYVLLGYLFLLILPPPPTSTLFPYTTLFRSNADNPALRRVLALSSLAAKEERAVIRRMLGEFEETQVTLRMLEATSFRRSEEHTSELQSLAYLVCRLLLEKKKKNKIQLLQAT